MLAFHIWLKRSLPLSGRPEVLALKRLRTDHPGVGEADASVPTSHLGLLPLSR